MVIDEGRGWLHDDLGIHHVVAAGQAHEQLALVEPRHVVLRKALEVFLADYGISGEKALKPISGYFFLLSGCLDKHQIFLAKYLERHSLQLTLVKLLKMNLPGEPRRKWSSFRPIQIKSSEKPC